MVSTIKFRSFKDLRLNWRTLLLVGFAVSSSAVFAVQFHISFALVWLLTAYVGIALAETLFRLSRRGFGRPVEVVEEEEKPAKLDA
jgi:CDP-diacylglycerol--serine O-phosphatidyltransferase